MDESREALEGDVVTVKEAATLLGVHPTTIRYRIKNGTLPATKILSNAGPMHVINRTDLAAQREQSQPLESRTNETAPIVHDYKEPPIGRDDLEALIQTFVAPFVQELGGVREELGKVKAERDAALQRIAELEARPMADTPAAVDPVSIDRRPWWRRILR